MPTSKRVLVVDDEDKILFVLRHALARLGSECEVSTSNNGAQALEMAREAPFDLIVTDLRMPQMDGVALTEAIRTLDYDPVVIWMTAYDYCTASADAQRLHVHRCLDKPLEVAEIRQIVREALHAAENSCTRGTSSSVH
jgi:CheY-like chemotaxis protein